jgi:ppGpp synthetase/RelA/SpoT-type nucleotidyltranferase
MALSKSAVDRAGENIRAAVRSSRVPAAGDMAVLEEFRASYLPTVVALHEFLTLVKEGFLADESIRDEVEHLAAGVGEDRVLSVASRPKTVNSIVAKLERETTRFSQMQDIAGGRLVIPSPTAQRAILNVFTERVNPDDTRPVVRITDTREHGDEHGYRAVHIVLRVDGLPAEIQVRTPLQQMWAQGVEDIDQRMGSDLKHGVGNPALREWLRELSDVFHRLEEGEATELPSPPMLDDISDE